MDAPGGNKVKIWQNLKVLNFDPDPTLGHVMSVKREQSLDELTVQVWLLYDHPNFKYCTLFASGTELWTDRQMIELLDAPGRPFRPGAKKCLVT